SSNNSGMGSGAAGSIFNNLPSNNGTAGSNGGMASGTSGAKSQGMSSGGPQSISGGLPQGMSPGMPQSMRQQGGIARGDSSTAGGATPPMDLLQPNASRTMTADPANRTTGARPGLAQGNGYGNSYDSTGGMPSRSANGSSFDSTTSSPNARSPLSSSGAASR